jgi:hypothetical protein
MKKDNLFVVMYTKHKTSDKLRIKMESKKKKFN